MDDAVNYGAIGAVIGHELTHGFDDEGRQFDAQGNLRDWWTEDAKAFDQRADCLVQQYGGYTAVDDIKLNGKLTLGENTADNGGLRLAYMALMEKLAGKEPPPKDGLHRRAALLPGLGTDLVPEHDARSGSPARPDRSALAGRISASTERSPTCRNFRKPSLAKWVSPWCAARLAESGKETRDTYFARYICW